MGLRLIGVSNVGGRQEMKHYFVMRLMNFWQMMMMTWQTLKILTSSEVYNYLNICNMYVYVNMYRLDNNLLTKIYEYDNTYKELFNVVLT